MTNEKLNIANNLRDEIEYLEQDNTNCNIMLNNDHVHLNISSSSLKFKLPKSIAKAVLVIAKNAIEEKLQEAKKEFESL